MAGVGRYMIYVEKGEAPKELERLDAQATQEIRKLILSKLHDSYHGKCAYCESIINTVLHRYRPVEQYPWLVSQWDNLLPICQQCSTARDSKYPLKGQPVTRPPSKDDWAADAPILLAEQPLLLHPEIHKPQEHLYFNESGQLQGKTEQGNYLDL